MSRISARDCEPVRIKQRKKLPEMLKKALDIERWTEKIELSAPYKQIDRNAFLDTYDGNTVPHNDRNDLYGLNKPFSSVSGEEAMETAGTIVTWLFIIDIVKELISYARYIPELLPY
ncbi:MAG: hypothetical protein NC427_06065 [Ruminococcus flavefaciens]|nr:hypothetical protein [Ruminococcus flavefaciens]